jgi:hypothetical protein
MVALNTFLLGGSVSFLGPQMVNPTARAIGLVFFLLSLGFAFVNMMPREASVFINSPDSMKELAEGALHSRMQWLKVSGFFMVIGLITVIVGMFLRAP